MLESVVPVAAAAAVLTGVIAVVVLAADLPRTGPVIAVLLLPVVVAAAGVAFATHRLAAG